MNATKAELITRIAIVVALFGSVARADQVFNDDVIVDGSLAVGFDAVNGENFGFDTIRLKENNLRIHFQDTSNSASFPTCDWRILINDTTNGGLCYFGIEDSDASTIPFRVENGAGNHALYVDSGGEIGLGTNSPVVELHLKDGDTPTVRLEQDGSSGFTPQTWDLAGNETNFFIRDVTNGSTLPFRIRPGAPSSAIDIAGDGDVGFGTSSPAEEIHVRDTDNSESAIILIEDTGTGGNNRPGFFIRSGNTNPVNSDWAFQVDGAGDFQVDFVPTTGPEFRIRDTDGFVQVFGGLDVAGTLTKGGGAFKIDHPLDPENKYLSHSFVESPDMLNIYNGNVQLDKNGSAIVAMPNWFGALNREFRYQLTAIGGAAPNLHIATTIIDGRFKIAGGQAGMNVSWQVTGVRKDPFAEMNRIPVEEDKPTHERGFYLHPKAYGQPANKKIPASPPKDEVTQLD